MQLKIVTSFFRRFYPVSPNVLKKHSIPFNKVSKALMINTYLLILFLLKYVNKKKMKTIKINIYFINIYRHPIVRPGQYGIWLYIWYITS